MANLLDAHLSQSPGADQRDPVPQAVAFLKVLFGQAPQDHYLEVRPLSPNRGDGSEDRRFFRLRQLQRRGFDRAVPAHLNGKANVFVGVLPRADQGGKARDVKVATCLWADLDNGWPAVWPTALPQPSIVVESSPGKFQLYYLLTQPTEEVNRVGTLVRRLAQAVGGDNVGDAPRILRLPGFQNLKYPERPVAQLREAHPQRCFSLAELDVVLPPLANADQKQGNGHARPQPQHGKYGVSFDPHWLCPLNSALQDRLVDYFTELNLRRCPDGRFNGPCPLPHRNGMDCDCEAAFYASPISGSWSCFCSDHLGQTSGTVEAFALEGLNADLTYSEMQSEVGKDHLGPEEVRQGAAVARPEKPTPGPDGVSTTVITKRPTYPSGDKRRSRGRRPQLWEESQQLFPLPTNVKPAMKGYLLWSERDLQGLAVDLFSNTWRNSANAQYKRQKLYANILPRVYGPQIYEFRVPIDDWDKTVHRRIAKRIQRAVTPDHGWLWVDNGLKRGYLLYLTDVPGLAEFEPVADVKPVLIDALRSISPPKHYDEDEGRFRPYGGSQNWVGKAEDSGEENAGRWEIVAVSQGPTDFLGVEAECVVAGVATEYRNPYWRGQQYHGLAMRHPSKEALVAFALRFPDHYSLTRSALDCLDPVLS